MQLTTSLLTVTTLLATSFAAPAPDPINSRSADNKADAYAIAAAASAFGITASAIAFGRIKPISSSNLCLTTTARDYLSPLIVNTCSSSLTQQWGIINTKGSTSYQFQNLDSGMCAQMNNDGFAGQQVTLAPCNNDEGDPVSNTLWDSGVSLSVTPTAVNFLKNRIHFKTQDWCMDTSGSNIVMFKCSSGKVSQKWLVGAS